MRAILAAAMLASVSACRGDPVATESGEEPPAGLASCGSAPLAVFPVPVERIEVIGPLGVMSGGGHLFPGPHLGLHPFRGQGGQVAVPVVSPGSIVITEVRRTLYGEGTSSAFSDFALFFFPCADVRMHRGHLSSLDPSLLSQIGSWSAADCSPPYTVGGVSVTQCGKRVAVNVERGAPLGTMVGTMDWGATDRRSPLGFVNASRMGGNIPFGQNYVVCPVDYLPPTVRASVHNLFGEGTRRRTAEPVCGTVMQDVPGTAQGRWFVNDDVDERVHLALVRDYIDPVTAAFSVGT